MVAVVLTNSPQPRIFWEEQSPAALSAYAGVRVTSAVNLLEDRAYSQLERQERLSILLGEEQSYIGALRDQGVPAAFDLRIVADPSRAVPLDVALLARTWNNEVAPDPSAPSPEHAAAEIVANLRSGLPRHVTGAPIDDEQDLLAFLRPFERGDRISSAVITKREVVGVPKRPDAKVDYYFNVVPFNWVPNDWNQLYAMLASSPAKVAISVALLPMLVPEWFTESLQHMATFYGRLARQDTVQGGLYFGQKTLPPDAFAVDAERVFADYARRYVGKVFASRIQVSAVGALPRGVVEMLASLVSPNESGDESHLERSRVSAAYDIRMPRSQEEQLLARWNLEAIDFIVLPGEPGIWSRRDPPPPHLRALCVLADAKDASRAYRLPAALDGTVPGFRVRKGQLGHTEAYEVTGAAISVGRLQETGQKLELPLGSLTKHALFAGSTGSGKTTSVMELLRQLWVSHHIPFLVIEPVNSDANDYRRLTALPGFEDLEVITAGDEDGAPLRFNPFEVPKSVLVGEHLANLLACFKAAFGLWEPLPSIYQDALNLTYGRAGILASERAGGVERRWPTVVEFMKAMTEVTQDLGYAGEVKHNIEAASIRRAQQLVSGPTASSFLTDQSLDVKALMDRPVIVELKSLGSGDEQSLMIALLLNAITEHYQADRGASSTLVHVTVIEEAHRLLARPQGSRGAEEAQAKEKAAEAFANTLAENRKYGEGIIISEQIPTKLVEDAVKNTNLKVMHRLTAEEDRQYLGRSMGMDTAQMQFATRIQTGEALAYSDEYAEVAHISVTRTITSPALGAPGPVARPPFSACGPCRSKCRYRGAALAIVRDHKVLSKLSSATKALRPAGLPPSEVKVRWDNLIALLRDEVRRYPALPVDEPGTTDAAFCLFVHSQSVRDMQASPKWPAAVAKRLGISTGGLSE